MEKGWASSMMVGAQPCDKGYFFPLVVLSALQREVGLAAR